jgi:hypothetical protein
MIAIATIMLLQLAGAGSFVPGQGGINSYYQAKPTISALTQSVDANTVVLSWTTSVASDSRAHCGSRESHDDGVQSGVTSHQLVVSGLAPSTGYTCTVQSGSTTQTIAATTTALAASTPITGLSYGTWTDYNATSPPFTMTGDTYYNTRSNDGITYLLTMDTSGWNGAANFTSSLLVAKFTSESPLTATTVNYLSAYGYPSANPALQPEATDPKSGGLISVAGVLYMTFARLDGILGNYEPITAGSLIASADHGAHWNNLQNVTGSFANGQETNPIATTLWPQIVSFTNWSNNNFVMYGADDGTVGAVTANNRFNDGNEFVYIVALGYTASNNTGASSVCNNDNAYLMRVPRSKIGNMNTNDYDYWVSGDGNLDSNWSKNAASAGVILNNTGKLGDSSIQYVPALNRYLWMSFYYPTQNPLNTANSQHFGYESPTPWGPWTQIYNATFTGTGYYSPIILQDSALAATFGTTTMTLLSTQNFQGAHYNLFYNTMTVSH